MCIRDRAYGCIDIDDNLPKFLKELESAGLQKIIDEKAAQFADWKKENGVS